MQVILALTTFQVPFFMLRLGQSKLYRRWVQSAHPFFSKYQHVCCCVIICNNFSSSSENYGKSFEDVTDLINNTFIRSEFGIAIGPENSGKVSRFSLLSWGGRLLRPSGPSDWFFLALSWFRTLVCRWSSLQKSLEVRAPGSSSPMTSGRASPPRSCPLCLSCKSHTTQRTPVCWRPSAAA